MKMFNIFIYCAILSKINSLVIINSLVKNKLVEGKGNLITSVEKLKKLGAKAKKSLPETYIKRAQEDDI